MKQHFIPKVYLKQFESSRKMLYTLLNQPHNNSPSVKERHRTQVGYDHDFYTINNPHNLGRLGLTDANTIENEFNRRVEDRFEKLLARLLSPTQMLTLVDAEEVLLMLLSFKQRNPVFRRALQNPQVILETCNRHFESVLAHRSMFEEILNREGRMNFDEFMEYGRNYIHQYAHNPDTPHDIHTDGIVRFHQNDEATVKRIAGALLTYEWLLFETTPQRPFVTSDNPGFCIDSNEQVHNLNFADTAGFIFPLTPKYVLIITAYLADQIGTVKQVHHRFAKYDLVGIINRGTFMVSYKKIFSNDANAIRYAWRDISRFMPHLTEKPVY